MASIKKDIGHEETDVLLESMEKRISKEYKQAEEEMQEKLDKYMSSFVKKDAVKYKQYQDGKISHQEYLQWEVNQMAVGKRWKEMRNTLAQDLTTADQKAKSIAYGYMPEVYAINHNYGAYLVDKTLFDNQKFGVDTSFTLYDRQTVEHLFNDQNEFYHAPGVKISKEINSGKTLAWNKKQVQSCMIQSILQGESIPDIAKRLATTVGEKNKNASIRNARTMTTGVENAGRVDSYKQAAAMGIDMEQEWLATLDGRTRHEHRMLDGKRVPVGKPFKVEGYEIRYPGDPAAEGCMVYNCRCTLIAALKGFSESPSDMSIRNTNKLNGLTYDGWKNQHTLATKKNVAMTKEMIDNDYEKWAERFQGNDLCSRAMEMGVERVDVKRLFYPLTEKEIISKVGGKDQTGGSCISAAYAYLGNKFGYDVRDFRGGASRMCFRSRRHSSMKMAEFAGKGIGSWIEKNNDDFKAANELLKKVQPGKEYILSTGGHGAIVRKTEKGFQYLELQKHPKENGWKTLDDSALKKRFGCKRGVGKRKEVNNVLIDSDFLKNSDDFRGCLEYINTPITKQKKG